MKNMLKKYGRLIWLFLILIVGFTGTIVASFLISKNTLINTLTEQSLPAISDNIYAEAQKLTLRPKAISIQLANDTVARDWLVNGEGDPEQISQFLKDIKNKNNALTSFLISDHTRHLYNGAGIAKTLNIAEPIDNWYFQLRSLKSPYEMNLNSDPLNHDLITISINSKVVDTSGKFIGLVGLWGINLNLDNLKNAINRYQQHSHSNIYFVNNQGDIVFSSAQGNDRRDNLNMVDGIKSIAKQILANQKNTATTLEYGSNGNTNLVSVRYLPEFGWHLIIDKNLDEELKPQLNVLLINVSIGLVLTLLLTIVGFFTIRRYEAKLEKSATTDTLTKLLNRHAFDFVFEQALLDAERSRQPMCTVLLDIDLFKKINDKQGHLVGNHVLREIAAISKRSLRESDVICRWGGEEFLILLKNCTLEKATSIAENLRTTIAANDFSRTTDLTRTRLSITVSMGVAECRDSETEDSVFERAEQALAQAKKNGRNSVYFSE